MSIIYGFLTGQVNKSDSGAFAAYDTETGVASYAYPSSRIAANAKRRPANAAAEMIKQQNDFTKRFMDGKPGIYDNDVKTALLAQDHSEVND